MGKQAVIAVSGALEIRIEPRDEESWFRNIRIPKGLGQGVNLLVHQGGTEEFPRMQDFQPSNCKSHLKAWAAGHSRTNLGSAGRNHQSLQYS